VASVSQESIGDTLESQSSGSKPKGQSITAHPVFPLIVALWFAALLGLGSLILPVTLIEKLVVTSGLPSLISATEPPLGFTARAAIALICTLVGALIGLFAARQVARSSRSRPAESTMSPSEFVRRQPLNAHEDLGEGGFDAKPGARRRSLAIGEEERPSEFFQSAPLPYAGDSVPLPETDAGIETDQPETQNQTVAAGSQSLAEPLDLSAEGVLAEPDTAIESPTGNSESIDALDETLAEASEEFAPEPQVFAGYEPEAAPLNEAVEETAPQQDKAGAFSPPTSLVQEEKQSTGHDFCNVECGPLAFSPPSLSPVASTGGSEEVNERGLFESDGTPLDELGLIQLVQRLENTISRHRQWTALRGQSARAPSELASAVPQAFTGAFETAEPIDAVQATADFFAEPVADNQQFEASEQPGQQFFESDKSSVGLHQRGAEDRADAASVSEPEPVRRLPPLSLDDFNLDDEDSTENDDEVAKLAASFSLPLKQESATSVATSGSVTPVSSHSIVEPKQDNSAHEPADRAAEEEDEAEIAAVAKHFAMPQSETNDSPSGPVESESEDPEESYSSLLQVQNQFRDQRANRLEIEEPEPETVQPAVIFPSETDSASTGSRAFDPPSTNTVEEQAPAAPKPSNDEADRALREALMNLQRMGKAS